MNIFKKLLKEPLIHFLLIGGGIFMLFNMVKSETVENPNKIIVTKGQMEMLASNFSRTWERSPTDKELDDLLKDYLWDEVYYREGLMLGLDKNDVVIRRRIRQKLDFIMEDATALLNPSDTELTEFMQAHKEQFRLPPRISFEQIYLSKDTRSDINADADAMLMRIKRGEDPKDMGDSIMLDYEYTLSSTEEINRRFGDFFMQQLLKLKPGEWQGPVSSGLGEHLVLITETKEDRIPSLDEVKKKVNDAWLIDKRAQLKEATFRKLLESYEVILPNSEVVQ